MGNTSSGGGSTSGSNNGSSGNHGNKRRSKHKKESSSSSNRHNDAGSEDIAARAQRVVGDLHKNISKGIQRIQDNNDDYDHPAAAFVDSVCGGFNKSTTSSTGNNTKESRRNKKRNGNGGSYDSDDDDSHQTVSEEETTVTEFKKYSYDENTTTDNDDEETMTNFDDDTATDRFTTATGDDTLTTTGPSSSAINHNNKLALSALPNLQKQPLASSFAKRCYFTKAGIGGHTQHYEGLTLNGHTILMLAAAMKLKGCPTICDEDLRRVEGTFPNQFSRLPDELLLSSGWRRISKYCHFSHKPIPDGIAFFHSKRRCHNHEKNDHHHHGGANAANNNAINGYYFLLASAVGMVRPMDVTPLDADTLVLLETDYPQACDTAPQELIKDPTAWILVDKFCFFSGGPINTEEDVYYEADLDGNAIYMLAFLSPNLTPNELYKLLDDDDDNDDHDANDNGETTANHTKKGVVELDTTAAVLEVERVYDLTERDFDDLKLYHLGPCRALPPYILQPQAWCKVLPPPFLVAKGEALRRARQAEIRAGIMMHDDDDADTHPYDDNDNHDGCILMMNQQQQQQKHRQLSYDAGDSPTYDDGVDDDRADEPFDQHHPHQHHSQPKSTTVTDSYRSFEPPHSAKYDPYDRFSAPVTSAAAPRTRGSSNHYTQPDEPTPPPSSSSMRHGGGRMEPPDGNDCGETDPVVFSRQQHDQQSRHLPQQQPHVRHAPPLHQIPHGSSSNNYASPPPPSASSSPYSDYHHHDYRRPDPKVLHSSGMDPPEDEPPSLRKTSMSASSSRYNNVGEPPQQHPVASAEESSDDQYTEPFAEPHDSYEPVDEYYDNEGRMEYPEYEPLDFAEDSPVTAQSDYHHHYRQHHHYQQAHHSHQHHPVVVTSPTASDGDFTDPTIGTFSPHHGGSGLPPTSPTRSQYSQNSALANEVLRRSSRTKQQPHHGLEYTNDALTPLSQPSASTWETDGTSEFSSVWTENEPDRTSRRALILQMAKARMKNNTSATTAGSTTTTGNGSGYGGKSSSSHYHHQHEVEDEKKLGDVDLRGDLD